MNNNTFTKNGRKRNRSTKTSKPLKSLDTNSEKKKKTLSKKTSQDRANLAIDTRLNSDKENIDSCNFNPPLCLHFASILSTTKIPKLQKLFLYKRGKLEWKTLSNYCNSEKMAGMISRLEAHEMIKVTQNMPNFQYVKLSTGVLNKLIENVGIVCKNQFSYHSFDPKTIKNEESKEKIILRHGICLLEKNLPLVAPSVNERVENTSEQIILDKQFSQVVRAYKRVMEIFTMIELSFRLCKDRSLFLEYGPFFQKIYKIYNNKLPGDGTPRKGAYPVTCEKELILLRRKRDEWMVQVPSIVKSEIEKGLHVMTS